MNPKPDREELGPVLLYDATCGLCNRAVRLLLRIDRRGALSFAALQGPAGQAWLAAHGMDTRDFETMVFVRDWAGADAPDGHALRTDALVAALEACGGAGRLLAGIRWLPRALRDGAYRLVSRARYRIFGEWRPRPLPRPEWERRFIGGPRP